MLCKDYDGPVRGINKDGSARADGKRSGSSIATKEYFASGRYEVRAKISPQLGVCSAFWTFHYQEFYPGDPQYLQKPVGGVDWYAINHEIDIEFPGRPSARPVDQSFAQFLANTWVGENVDEYEVNYASTGALGDLADGKFHNFRFDWHTGGPGIEKTVEVSFLFFAIEHFWRLHKASFLSFTSMTFSS